MDLIVSVPEFTYLLYMISGRVKPKFRDVFILYSSLTPGLTVKDLCMRHNLPLLKIDEK